MLAANVPWILLVSGALGVVLGVDRTLKRREKESRLLQVLAFVAGTALFAVPMGLVLRSQPGTSVSGVSVLLMLLLAICLVGRALKSLPIAFIIVAVTGTGLFWLLSYAKQFSFAGDIPIQPIALLIAILLLVVFAVSFMIEKAIDFFLWLISLGPVVFIVAAAALVHGVLVGLHITDQHGLLNLIKTGAG